MIINFIYIVSSKLKPFPLCVPHVSFGAIPQLSGSGRPSAALLPAGQPRQQQRSSHQLQGLSDCHICGGQDAPACGEVQHMQRGHGEYSTAGGHWHRRVSVTGPVGLTSNTHGTTNLRYGSVTGQVHRFTSLPVYIENKNNFTKHFKKKNLFSLLILFFFW